jgi:hypothetical protein
MALDLRPLSLGELLDRAFTLYRAHFRLFVGIMAVPSVFGLSVAFVAAFLQRATRVGNGVAPGTVPDLFTIGMLVSGLLVVMFAYFVVYTVALGASATAVSELYLGRSVGVAEVYERVRGQLGRLILLMIFFGLRVVGAAFVGLMLVSVVGVVAALAAPAAVAPILGGVAVVLGFLLVGVLCAVMVVRYGVAVPALVLEHLKAGEALKRSVELTQGHRWRVFVVFVLATVVAYAGLALFQGTFQMASFIAGPETTRGFWLNLAGVTSGTIGGTLTAPIMVVGLALLYYDTRIRHEGLDLDLMLADLDRKGNPPDIARA